jgi:hypothetical protein
LLFIAQFLINLPLNPPLRYGVNTVYRLACSIDERFCSVAYLSIKAAYLIPNIDVPE